MGHGFGCGDGSGIDGVRAVLMFGFLLSDVWLSSLPGVRSCGDRHGPVSGLSLLGLFVLGFCC